MEDRKKRKAKAMLAILLILALIVPTSQSQSSPSGGESYLYPLHVTTYIQGVENITTFRFRVYNPYNFSTSAFRISMSSNLNWFYPKNLTYPLQPDGYTQDGWPYWEVPPLATNESTEVSFLVNRSVGLSDLIDVQTEILDNWSTGCRYLAPYGNENSAEKISKYLESLNQSQNVTVYYENGNLSLAHLDRYGVFAVFRVDGTNVTALGERDSVSALVSEYATAVNMTKSGADTAKPYDILTYARELKAGPENNCSVITGMDRFPCTNRTSCFYACFSVPVCSNIGQSGWAFIDTLLDYKNSIDYTNTVLDRAVASASAFESAPSYDTANKSLADLEDLNRAETTVIFHPLFTSYGFCQPPEYAMPQQIEAKRQLLDYLADNCLYGEETRIVDESMHTASKLNPPVERPVPANATAAPQPPAKFNVTGNKIPLTCGTTGGQVAGQGCCWNGICSLAGFGTMGGLCWEWWLLLSGFLVLCIAVLVAARGAVGKGKG